MRAILLGLMLAAPVAAFAQTGPQGAVDPNATMGKSAFANLVSDYGAKCDATYSTNITDDSANINAAMAGGKVISIPAGKICFGATISQAGITAIFVGPGQIKTSDGNLRGPIVSQLMSAPVRFGGSNVVQGFNGDYSQTPTVVERRVTGSATLGQPTTGYKFTNEAAANYTYFYNDSGWNNAIGTAGPSAGRTGVGSNVVNLFHNGQGDAMANFSNVFVNGPNKTGATSFLANPAAAILAGQVVAGHAGVFLQGLGDIDLSDNGYDVAGIGTTVNLTRTTPSASLGTTWIGHRVQSNGAVSSDAAFSMSGTYRVAIDLADAAGTQAAVAMQAGQRIYFNTTQPDTSGVNFPSTLALGTEYMDYSPTNGFEMITANGSLTFGTANNRFSVGPGQTNTSNLGTALGGYNAVSGVYAVVMGAGSVANGRASVVMGLQASDRGNDGAKCNASGDFAAAGDAQGCKYVLRGVTTTTAGKLLTTDGNAPSVSPANCIQIPANTSFGLDITVMARDYTTPNDYSNWRITQAVMSRDTSTNYAGSAPVLLSRGGGSGSGLTVAADATKGCLAVTFTAPNTDTWHVVATVRTTEVQ